MITRYREKIYKCGEYLEVSIYPAYKNAKQRNKKAKPTSQIQKKLNQRNAENKITRLLNENFTPNDIQFNLSYNNRFLPRSDEEAARELRNFLRRVKRYRKRNSMPALKYIAVTEKGKRSGRYHHHIVMNGGIDINTLAALWGRGYTTTKPLQFDETGLIGLARYIVKEPVASKKRWNASKNLVHPQARIREGRLSKRKVLELARDTENTKEYERYYSGYYLAEAHKVINDINGGVYIQARFYSAAAPLYWNNHNNFKAGCAVNCTKSEYKKKTSPSRRGSSNKIPY